MRCFLLHIALILAFTSCKKNVETVTITTNLSAFDHVRLHSPFTVILHESDDFSIEITAVEDRIDFIEFSSEDGLLSISNNKKAGWLNPNKNSVEIHIYSQPLSLLEAEETCDISTANPITSEEFGIVLKSKVNEANLDLNCGTFYYWNNTPAGGKLRLSGECELVKIWNHALMSVDAKDLVANHALIENSSKGIIEVAPLDKLEYSIFDIGDIHLYSSPEVIAIGTLNSTGRLVQF